MPSLPWQLKASKMALEPLIQILGQGMDMIFPDKTDVIAIKYIKASVY